MTRIHDNGLKSLLGMSSFLSLLRFSSNIWEKVFLVVTNFPEGYLGLSEKSMMKLFHENMKYIISFFFELFSQKSSMIDV